MTDNLKQLQEKVEAQGVMIAQLQKAMREMKALARGPKGEDGRDGKDGKDGRDGKMVRIPAPQSIHSEAPTPPSYVFRTLADGTCVARPLDPTQ